MNAADASEALEHGDAQDKLNTLRWMDQHTEMTMSDTPRTDNNLTAIYKVAGNVQVVPAHISRQLERELADANARADALAKEADHQEELKIDNASLCEQMRTELAAARAELLRIGHVVTNRESEIELLNRELAAMRERAERAERDMDMSAKRAVDAEERLEWANVAGRELRERAEQAESALTIRRRLCNEMREMLGVQAGMDSDEELAQGMAALKALRERAEKAEAERDEARACLRAIRPFVMEDYHPGCITPEFDAAVSRLNAALGEVQS